MSFLRTLYLRGISYGIVCSVLSSAAIEIIPGVGLEDCHVGMDVNALKGRIFAVDERWGAWYLNQGEIRVVHDGANVLKLFFTCHINNMPDDPFTPKEPFMGSVRGLTNSMQNITFLSVTNQFGVPPLVEFGRHWLLKSARVPFCAILSYSCKDAYDMPMDIDFADRGITFLCDKWGKVQEVGVMPPSCPLSKAVPHGAVAVVDILQGRLDFDFGDIASDDRRVHYLEVKNLSEHELRMPRGDMQNENICFGFGVTRLLPGQSTYVMFGVKPSSSSNITASERILIPFMVDVGHHTMPCTVKCRLKPKEGVVNSGFRKSVMGTLICLGSCGLAMLFASALHVCLRLKESGSSIKTPTTVFFALSTVLWTLTGCISDDNRIVTSCPVQGKSIVAFRQGSISAESLSLVCGTPKPLVVTAVNSNVRLKLVRRIIKTAEDYCNELENNRLWGMSCRLSGAEDAQGTIKQIMDVFTARGKMTTKEGRMVRNAFSSGFIYVQGGVEYLVVQITFDRERNFTAKRLIVFERCQSSFIKRFDAYVSPWLMAQWWERKGDLYIKVRMPNYEGWKVTMSGE